MTKPYNIFISYASEDEAFVNGVAEELQYRGVSIWYAPINLKIGDNLLDSINAGLIASEYGLLVLSDHYISKRWTRYELDVLQRQHIEGEKRLLPLWHGVEKSRVDVWNPGLSGVIALRSTTPKVQIAEQIADIVFHGAPLRGVAPIYEDPEWRFLQGRGELLANNRNGSAFNLFEAAEFPDRYYPIYIRGQLYTRNAIVLKVASALYYRSHDEVRLTPGQGERMRAICKEYGYDLDSPGFDPAVYG